MVKLEFDESEIKTQTPMSKEFADKIGHKLYESYMSAAWAWSISKEQDIKLEFIKYSDGSEEWSLVVNYMRVMFEYAEELVELLAKLKIKVKNEKQ